MTYRALMIRRWDPAHRDQIADIFRAHDATELPGQIGATRRTLFGYNDLYFHLIEAEDDFRQRLFAAVADQRFRTVDDQLAGLLTPYDPTAPSMAQAQAEPFYDWKRSP